MQDAIGVNATGIKNETFQIQGNDTHLVSFPLATYDHWYEGDRVFLMTLVTHAGGTHEIWTQLLYDDPATSDVFVPTPPTATSPVVTATPTAPTKTPIGPLAIGALVVAALVLAGKRRS